MCKLQLFRGFLCETVCTRRGFSRVVFNALDHFSSLIYEVDSRHTLRLGAQGGEIGIRNFIGQIGCHTHLGKQGSEIDIRNFIGRIGHLPIAIQIPVFFSLYKVLFVTIEMRHAPFFGWIKDLSAPDPTNIFNLFGLIPFDPTTVPMVGHFLHVGAWGVIMGITMWAQMKLNPSPPDPTQKMIFDWMPLIFTFMLASFPAGLVIYWAWNNSLSVAQQSVIMRKHGAKIELIDNIKALFVKKKTQE